MSGTKIDRAAREDVAAGKDDALITRAAKRTDWAGTALESAAGDLDGTHESKSLASLAEVVLNEAAIVSRLAQDIDSRKADGDGDTATNGKKGGSSKGHRG
jgi:hypothetical protein